MSSSTTVDVRPSKKCGQSRSNEFRRLKKFCDVVITVNGKQFHCHRIILASTTSYFRIMFGANYCEANEREIELKDVNEVDFELLLTYIYGGSVALNESANAYRLLRVSLYVSLDTLDDLYSEYVKEIDAVPVDSAVRILLMAGRVGNTRLEDEYAKRVAKDFGIASRSRKLLQISSSALVKIFSEPLAAGHANAVLDFLIEWLKFRRTDNEDTEVLPELLRTLIVSFDLYLSNEWIVKMILENNMLYREVVQSKKSRLKEEVTKVTDGVEPAATASTTNENPPSEDGEHRLFSDVENDDDDDDDDDYSYFLREPSVSLPFTLYTRDFHTDSKLDCTNRYKFRTASDVNLMPPSVLDVSTFQYASIEFCKSLLVDGVHYTMTVSCKFTEKEEQANISVDSAQSESSPRFDFEFVPFVQHESDHHSKHSSGNLHDTTGLLDTAVIAYDRSIYCHINGLFYMYDCELDRWLTDGEAGAGSVPVCVKTRRSNLVSYNHCLYVIGGEAYPRNSSSKHEYNDCCKYFQRYDFREKKCVLLPKMNYGRISSASCVHDDLLYVTGGRNLTYYKGGIECYDFTAGKWCVLETSMPEPRFNHTLIPYDNKLWFFGGDNHLFNSWSGSTSDLSWYSYDLKKGTWSKTHRIYPSYGKYRIDRILDVTML